MWTTFDTVRIRSPESCRVIHGFAFSVAVMGVLNPNNQYNIY
jgi:hypothetical protein